MRRKGLTIRMKSDPTQEDLKEADKLRFEAEKLRMKISKKTTGDSQLDTEDEDLAYDELVCGYYR